MIHPTIDPSPTLTWIIIAAQVLGVIAVWAVRRSEGSRLQPLCQTFFLAALTMVGIGTAAGLWIGPGCWLASGATLAVMVLGATCEFSRRAARTCF